MRLLDSLRPDQNLSRLDRVAGLAWLTRNGIASQGMETLTTGAFIVAFALSLGASNLMIGVLAAVPHLTQLAQIPGVFLVERLRQRRLICVAAGSLSRPMLLVMAASAFLPAPWPALAVLTLGFALRYALGAVVGASWNAWIREIVPERRMGRFFARRLLLMTLAGALLSLVAAAFVDWWLKESGLAAPSVYALLLSGAFLFGIASVWCMTRMPEPPMAREKLEMNFGALLKRPFTDGNFRRLIAFLGSWNFAVNLAAPFFAVHMLRRLELDLSLVVLLTILSQIANILTLKEWGRIADRFSNKSVLAICAPLFIACIFAWIFTTFPEPHALTLPLLVAIHIFTGIATAGVTLASGNIGLKLAPRGEASAYLAAIALTNALAAGIAPMLGGLAADFFLERELSLLLHWSAPGGDIEITAVYLRRWDFFFLSATILGLYSIHRLALVRELGETAERVVLSEVLLDARRAVRNLSSIAGLRMATEFPLEFMRRSARRRARRRRREALVAAGRAAGEKGSRGGREG